MTDDEGLAQLQAMECIEVPYYGQCAVLARLANLSLSSEGVVVKPFDPASVEDMVLSLEQAGWCVSRRKRALVVSKPAPLTRGGSTSDPTDEAPEGAREETASSAARATGPDEVRALESHEGGQALPVPVVAGDSRGRAVSAPTMISLEEVAPGNWRALVEEASYAHREAEGVQAFGSTSQNALVTLAAKLASKVVALLLCVFLLGCAPSTQDVLWEEIPTPTAVSRTHRTPTPNGWLVVTNSGACEVDDPAHLWLRNEARHPQPVQAEIEPGDNWPGENQ